MKVNVKNLGALKEAHIDLNKKINIFCGPNSTGKTYLAYLLYSITNINNKSIGVILEENYIQKLSETNFINYKLNFNTLWDFKEKELLNIKENLSNLFAVADSKAEKFFSSTTIVFENDQQKFENKLFKLKLNQSFTTFDFKVNVEKEQDSDEILISMDKNIIKDESYLRFIEIVLLSRVYSVLVFYPIISSTILPVERNSIYTFSDELSVQNVERYQMIKELSTNKDFNPLDILFKRSKIYPQPIRDGLRVADTLKTIQLTNSTYYNYALELEEELLNGKVLISSDGSVEFASNRAKTTRLSFHQSSSIVKTLSSLVIYLKHIAVKNDLVIIDEPELNLHPDNQVKLTRIIARLVNQGLRFIISTHSDYMVREFSNLIMLSNIENKIDGLKQNQASNIDTNNDKNDFSSEINTLKSKLGYMEGEYIKKEDVNATFFNYKNKTSRQSITTKVAISEYGFEVQTLDETIDNINNVTEEFYYTLKDLENDNSITRDIG